jgi:predicted transcriptional regulator
VEIKVLARRGTAVREIARQTGLSRNTVRRYLRNEQASRYSQNLRTFIVTSERGSPFHPLAEFCRAASANQSRRLFQGAILRNVRSPASGSRSSSNPTFTSVFT